MSQDTFETLPVKIGFAWTLTLVDPKPPLETDPDTGVVTNTAPLFPDGAEYLADLVQDGQTMATITTANGGFERLSDTELSLTITETASAALSPDRLVEFDIIRTDVTPAEHLNIEFSIPVQRSLSSVP